MGGFEDIERYSGSQPGLARNQRNNTKYNERLKLAQQYLKSGVSSTGTISGMEAPDPEGGGAAGIDVQKASHPDTGSGYTIPGTKDASGRPPIFSKGAAMAFARMMKDSKGVVKPSDIASSQRSAAKNASLPGASSTSNHLKGNAMDIHGASQTWIRKHGKKYGWHINDYRGSHGGHFDFKGAGGGSDSSGGTNIASSSGSGARTQKPERDRGYTAAAAPAAAPAAPANGTGLSNASAQYTAMGLTTGGGTTNNIYNTQGGSSPGQGALAPNMFIPSVGAALVGPGWAYEILAARLG